MDLSRILFVLGVGFLLANVRLFVQFIRFLRLRSSALAGGRIMPHPRVPSPTLNSPTTS